MKKIIFIDTFSVGGFHEMFNASFLYVVLNNSTSPVTYVADESAINAIRQLLKDDLKFQELLKGVTFKSKNLPKGISFYAIFFRYLYGAFFNIFYLFQFRTSRIIFPALNPLFGIFLKIFVKIFNTETYVVCHGELGYLFSKHRVSSPLFWYTSFLRPFFAYSMPETLKLILLGPSIVKNFTAHYPKLLPNILTVNHPYIFNQNQPQVRKVSSIVRFGWVGVATEAKGFPIFDEITRYFSAHYPKQFSAHFVGWHPFSEEAYPQIHFASRAHVFLDRGIFNQAVSQLDYILFFYNNSQYQYTASGAIFDAIQHNKFIIALHNDYFESIFSACGPIGFLCDSKEEIFRIIESILRNEVDVQQFFLNLQVARTIFSCRQMKLML